MLQPQRQPEQTEPCPPIYIWRPNSSNPLRLYLHRGTRIEKSYHDVPEYTPIIIILFNLQIEGYENLRCLLKTGSGESEHEKGKTGVEAKTLNEISANVISN